MSDQDLDAALEDARGGGAWGATALYRSLNPPLLRYLHSQTSTVADDLAADTWVAAVRNLRTFQGSGQDFRIWLFTVARRRLVDHRRRQSRREIVALDPDRLVASDDPADAVLDELSAREAVEKITAALPGDQAEVVVLRVLAGLRVDEVAQVMGRSPGSVRVLQHRALRRLEKNFQKVVTP